MAMDLSELRPRDITELVDVARDLGIDNASGLRRQELIFEIVRRKAGSGGGALGGGVLETLPDGFGFLRSPHCNYLPGPDDIYVSPSQIRRFNLRTGDEVGGRVRAPKEGERYFALIKIETVNDRSPDIERNKLLFDNLTPVHTSRRLPLDAATPGLRMVDAVAPLGFGQRVLVHAPVHAGRTRLCRELADCIADHAPDTHVVMVLVDERPEEVTELREVMRAEVLSSTFDEPPDRHVQVAEMALERARRLVEQGRDVVVFFDSLTRLARALNAVAPPGGRQLAGQVDAMALHQARRLFGAGRCMQEGGSLTVIATVLTGTQGAVDELLLEELEGTANAEVKLDVSLARGGVWPALDLMRSYSRDTGRLVPATERASRVALRATLSGDPERDHATLMARIHATADNHAMLGELDKDVSVGK